MSNIRFHGIYAEYLKQFIEFKRNMGFKYQTEERMLLLFDRLTITLGEKEVGITKKFTDIWCVKRENESYIYRYNRNIALNQFSLYLSRIGIPSYISHIPKPKKSFTPYIYTEKEINAIFKVCDNLRCERKRMNSSYMVIPSLVRLLYGTGIRIGEALNLKTKDINLFDNFLIIKDAKNGKERVIPFSSSLSSVLQEYASYRDKMPLNRTEESFFFVQHNGNCCNSHTIYIRFQYILRQAGILFIGGHRGPRVHDLRHTFAVHSLAMMTDNNMDIYCSLPILSTYLGHLSLESTNQYVRLTAECYPNLVKQLEDIYINVFPEIQL
jgi:integrase